MNARVLTAPRVATGLLVTAIALATASQVQAGDLELLAWTLMGVIAGFSLSGSV